MTREQFHTLLKEKVLILDGAMGTMIMKKKSQIPNNLTIQQSNNLNCPETYNVLYPELIKEIHSEYILAGADVIETNTFGGTRIKLDSHKLGNYVEEYNRKAVAIAKESANGKALVAGSVGPTGKLIEPLGELSFDSAIETFKEQIYFLADEGCDFIIIETISDIQEMRSAIIAGREVCDLPIVASITFTQDGRTVTGTDALTALTTLSAMDIDAIGANCSVGVEHLIPIIEIIANNTDIPIIAQPNAGLPKLINNETIFPATIDEQAEGCEKLVNIGVNLIGGCCGTTPEYIKAIANKVKGRKPANRKSTVQIGDYPLHEHDLKNTLTLSSRTKTIFVGNALPFCIIGERINPTSRKVLSSQIKEGKTSLIRSEAMKQVESGANVLDVNIGVPNINESEMMVKSINAISNVVNVPLCIDTSNIHSLESALKVYPGKALINSISGETDRMEKLLPLAKKYGSAFIALPVDEHGVPESADKRLQIAEKIIKSAEKIGISRKNIVVDGLVMTVSANQNSAMETIETIRRAKKELGVCTILGISNVSFGLPNRELLNSTFLAMAMAVGLDMAIVNPYSESIKDVILSSSVLTGRDKNAIKYIENEKARKRENESISVGSEQLAVSNVQSSIFNLQSSIENAVYTGAVDTIDELLESALKDGFTPNKIIDEILIPAITEVGRRFEQGIFFLPQLILSAEVVRKGFAYLKPLLKLSTESSKGKILLATVKGDVHDIGKNIVAVFFENNGFKVIDLGKDVPSQKIIESAINEKVDIIGLSALMTTTMTEMRNVINLAKESKCSAKIIIGGAVVTEEYAKEIGADGYGKNAVAGVEVVKRIMSGIYIFPS